MWYGAALKESLGCQNIYESIVSPRLSRDLHRLSGQAQYSKDAAVHSVHNAYYYYNTALNEMRRSFYITLTYHRGEENEVDHLQYFQAGKFFDTISQLNHVTRKNDNQMISSCVASTTR